MQIHPLQALQTIHQRGEQAAVPARIHDEARHLANQLETWINNTIKELEELKAANKTLNEKDK